MEFDYDLTGEDALAAADRTNREKLEAGDHLENQIDGVDPYTTEGVDPFAGTRAYFVEPEDSRVLGLTDVTRNQAGNSMASSEDWRVKLSLARNSDYLYNARPPGILGPLKDTNGVIFPYTPAIDTAYKANYSNYDLTHSNYRGHFYQNSYTDEITLKCPFTAQNTFEANYLLAVIHFFRSVTKMFYGKDTQSGSPPPLVFLSGLGPFQFNNHPCLVSRFNYTLPQEVDYIRARIPHDVGTSLQTTRPRQTTTWGTQLAGLQRLLNAGINLGAMPNESTTVKLSYKGATYIPTKLEISISLLPIQSRENISKNFSLKEFATGELLRKGYW